MWLLMSNDNLFLMDSRGNPQDVVTLNNNKLTIPKKWITRDTNLIINHNHVVEFEEYKFNKIKLADFAKKEASKRLAWGIDKEAYKYTNQFKSVFGYNKRFPWCSAFVTYCLKGCNVNVPVYCSHFKPYTYALCESYQKMAIKNNWYVENTITNVPEIGDIILFDWRHKYNEVDTDWEDHIGICVDVINNNLIITAEGNRNNKSGVFRRQLKNVEGFIRIPNNVNSSNF